MINLLTILVWSATSLIPKTRFAEFNIDSIPRTTTSVNRENLIVHKILALPELKVKNKFVDSLTQHKHGISILILKRPTKSENYYWVQAGYDNEIRFEPYYSFYVYNPNLAIKYFNPLTNNVYNLSEWRRKKDSVNR